MEGGSVGRILSYNDLSDVKHPASVDDDLDFSEFMTEEEKEEAMLEKKEREKEEKELKKEEEKRILEEKEQKEREAEEERINEEVYFH